MTEAGASAEKYGPQPQVDENRMMVRVTGHSPLYAIAQGSVHTQIGS